MNCVEENMKTKLFTKPIARERERGRKKSWRKRTNKEQKNNKFLKNAQRIVRTANKQ